MPAEACQHERGGSGAPRAWPRRPTPWNGNGRRQTAKQTLGEQLWVTYILGRNHADGPQGTRFTARKLLEPEIWPGACGISRSRWLWTDMKLRSQSFYSDMTDHSLWSRETKIETIAKKKWELIAIRHVNEMANHRKKFNIHLDWTSEIDNQSQVLSSLHKYITLTDFIDSTQSFCSKQKVFWGLTWPSF